MQNLNSFASTVSSIAMLTLAVLPIAALSTAAQAAQASVKIADLNLASQAGVTAFNRRAEFAAQKLCNTEISLSARANCRADVKTQLNEKMNSIRSAQAARVSTTFAAR